MTPNIPISISITLIVLAIVVLVVLEVMFYMAARRADISGQQASIASILIGAWLALWLVTAWSLAQQGFFRAANSTGIPNIVYVLIPLVVSLILMGVSPVLRKIMAAVPQHWLIGVQVYRIGGALFLMLYAQRLLPDVFALPAGIGDVVVGLAAPVVAYLSYRQHRWARPTRVIWNLVGILDLLNAVTLGVLSAPGPLQQFAFDAPYDVIPVFPVVLIPTVLVPLSILLHVISLNKELRSSGTVSHSVSKRAAAAQ